MEGDLVQILVLGQSLIFQAIQVRPSNTPVIVDDETQVKVLEKPVENVRIPRVTWEDIGDLEEAKQKIRELVELPLKHLSCLGILVLSLLRVFCLLVLLVLVRLFWLRLLLMRLMHTSYRLMALRL
jgi:ATP-dependent 26S proteasome regulatory subunit